MASLYNYLHQGTTQQVAYTGGSAGITTAFGAQTRVIRIVADSACNYRIGTSAQTATTADPYLPPNWYEYVAVTPGQFIAAIRAATDGNNTAANGTLWVTEMN